MRASANEGIDGSTILPDREGGKAKAKEVGVEPEADEAKGGLELSFDFAVYLEEVPEL